MCWPALGSARSCLRLSTGQSAAFGGPARTPAPRPGLHSANPIERLNKEVKRRADVVGFGGKTAPPAVFVPASLPNEAAIMRLIGAVLFEQNDEWQTASRYMMVEAFAQIDKEEIDPILGITTKAA